MRRLLIAPFAFCARAAREMLRSETFDNAPARMWPGDKAAKVDLDKAMFGG